MSILMKWSGSKDSQKSKIISYFPKEINTYIEPFLGGGSIFLELLETDINVKKYVLSDLNKELIGIYQLIKDNPDSIIETYNKHYNNFNKSDFQQRKDYFSEIRKNFNENKNSEDFYWLQRTCTNGAVRYNRNGEYNQSCHFSRPGMNPNEVEKIIRKYSILFSDKHIIFNNCSYEDISYDENDLLYMDPPYFNTKGQYFSNFDNLKFLNWYNKLTCKAILSYDGKVNNIEINHVVPNYVRHEYLVSGNSSFRRIVGNSNDSVISESLYMNF